MGLNSLASSNWTSARWFRASHHYSYGGFFLFFLTALSEAKHCYNEAACRNAAEMLKKKHHVLLVLISTEIAVDRGNGRFGGLLLRARLQTLVSSAVMLMLHSGQKTIVIYLKTSKQSEWFWVLFRADAALRPSVSIMAAVQKCFLAQLWDSIKAGPVLCGEVSVWEAYQTDSVAISVFKAGLSSYTI